MNSITVAEKLWFEETMLGATLNFCSQEHPEGVLFRVGISFKSLEECSQQLQGNSTMWAIKDGSLTIYGDREQLTLTFTSVDGQYLESALSLYGEELKVFKYAVNAFAARNRTYLN